MNIKDLRELLENSSLSAQAYDIIDAVLDYVDEDVHEADYYDLEEAIQQEIDSQFIYYSDAWDYLQDNNITDFTDAINEYGVTDLVGIASYYLMQEIMDNFLSEVE